MRLMIYVAGPYTQGDVAANIHKAIEVGTNIRALGHETYVPHLSHFEHLLFPQLYEYWLAHDMAWLLMCDAVFRIEGESSGADKEVAAALKLGMPVFTSFREIPKVA